MCFLCELISAETQRPAVKRQSTEWETTGIRDKEPGKRAGTKENRRAKNIHRQL